MSDLNNIDKLLKDNFVDFTPDVPDVWQGIQQGVQAAKVAQTSGTVAATKGVGLAVKVIGSIIIGAATITGYVMLSTDKPAIPIASNQPETNASQLSVAPESITETVQDNNTPAQTQQIDQPSVQREQKKDLNVSKSESLLKTDVPFQDNEATEVKEESGKETLLQEKAAEPESSAPVMAKDQPKQEVLEKKAPQPYNPYEEMDEVGKPTVPNTFSPNGDGLNDKFVILIDNEQLYSLMILDKNGKLVFESNDKNNVWDGRDYKSGAVCPTGTYYMVFRYQLKGSQSERRITGTIDVF
jgi:gliding motility-associated-like protein